MPNKKIENLLNQRDIKDLINENIMLREFSMYGCDDQPSKVHGYNPFSKKCIDITNYQGPDAPKSILRPIKKPDREDQIASVTDSIGDFAGFIWDIYKSGVDYKEIADCVSNNPVFSFLGLFYGRGTIKILPMLAQSSGKAIYSAFTKTGKLQNQIDTYVSARKGTSTGLTNFLKRLATGALSSGYKAGKWGTVAGVMGTYFILNAGRKENQGENYMPWANKALDIMEKNISGGDSKQNWKCFFASAVTGVVAGVLIKGGARGLLKTAKNVKSGRWNVAADLIKSAQMRKWFANAIKDIKSDQLVIFKALQESGTLPSKVKIVVDNSSGLNRLKVKGLGDQPIRIPSSGMPASLQKYAVNGELVLDPKLLKDELVTVSDDINKAVQQSSGESLSLLRSSNFYKNVKGFKKAMEKYGNLPRAQIRSKALKNTSEILQDLSKSLDSSLQSVSQLQKNVQKGKDQVRKLFDDIEGLANQKGYEKIEKEILDSATNINDVQRIIDSALPGIDNVPTSFVGGERVNVKEFVINHFKETKKLDITKKGIISDIEFARKAILDDTGVVKSLFPGGNGADDLSDWLSSSAGAPYRDVWSKLDSNGDRLAKIAATIGPKTATAVRSLFTTAVVPVAAFTLGVNLVSMFSAKKIDDKEQLDEIVRLIDEKLIETSISKYMDKDGNIKVETLLSDLIKAPLANKDSFMSDTVNSLKQFRDALKTNKEYIKDINSFTNDEETYLTKESLRRKIKAIVRGTLSPKGQNTGPKKNQTSNTTGLLSQIPEGDLKAKSPFSVSLGAQNFQIQFTDKHISIGEKKFQFSKFGVDANIEQVTKNNNKITAKLVAGIIDEIFVFSESDLQSLFQKAVSLQTGEKISIQVGGKTGNIKRISENREVLQMSKKNLKQLVSEVLNEAYGKYPYHSNEHTDEEADEDYMVEWNALVDEVCGNKKKNFDGDPKTFEDAAVEVAKLFVKDSELFREVLELAGSNKSVGVEIMQQLKAAKEKSLDKELKV